MNLKSMIELAIQSSRSGKLTIKNILSFIRMKFPNYNSNSKGTWYAIEDLLILDPLFAKIEPGKHALDESIELYTLTVIAQKRHWRLQSKEHLMKERKLKKLVEKRERMEQRTLTTAADQGRNSQQVFRGSVMDRLDTPGADRYHQQGRRSPSRELYRSRSREVFQSPPREAFQSPVRETIRSQPRGDIYGSPVRGTYRSPIRDTYRSPIREAYRSPVREIHRSPGRASYRSPLRNPYRSPIREADRSPGRDPYRRSPIREADRSPGREPVSIFQRLNQLYPNEPNKFIREPERERRQRSPIRDRSPLRDSYRGSPPRQQLRSPQLYPTHRSGNMEDSQSNGHFAKDCTNPAVPRPRPEKEHKLRRQQPRPPKECFNCQSIGHSIRDCPKLDCKRCGATGHFAKECQNAPKQFMFKGNNAAPSGGAVAPSPGFGFSGASSSGNGVGVSGGARPDTWTKPSQFVGGNMNRSLLSYFCEKLLGAGHSAHQGDEMMKTWQMAGHSEDSLKVLVLRENPKTQAQLRLALVKELSNVSAGHIPRSVNVGSLLDETVSYFMPTSDFGTWTDPSRSSSGYFGAMNQGSLGIQMQQSEQKQHQQQGGGQQQLPRQPMHMPGQGPSSFHLPMPIPMAEQQQQQQQQHRPQPQQQHSGFSSDRPSQSDFSSRGQSGGVQGIWEGGTRPRDNRADFSSGGRLSDGAAPNVIQGSSGGGPSSISSLESAIQNINSIERFRELEDMVNRESMQSPQMRREYEGRLQSLAPLKDFISSKMRIMSDMFGISEDYIFTVSNTIQKLMAHVGLCLFTLKRMFHTYGRDSVTDSVGEKLGPFSASFPRGVTVKYIVNMVNDFLQEFCRN